MFGDRGGGGNELKKITGIKEKITESKLGKEPTVSGVASAA